MIRYAVSIAIAATSLCGYVAGADGPLPTDVAVTLSPEFCQAEVPALNTKAKYKIGPILCDELRVALRSVFAHLTKTTTSGGRDGSIRLLPRVVSVTNAGGGAAWAEVETTVSLEWTVKEPSGATMWSEIVQGSAKHKLGTLFTYNKNAGLIMTSAAKAVAARSAATLSSAPELQNEEALRVAVSKAIRDEALRSARPANFSRLRVGMTLDEVESLLGPATARNYEHFRQVVHTMANLPANVGVNKTVIQQQWKPEGLTREAIGYGGGESFCSWTDATYSMQFDRQGLLKTFSPH